MTKSAPIRSFDVSLLPLRPQPEGQPWPTARWPEARPPHPAADKVNAVLERIFTNTEALGETDAVIVVHKGAIVAERYRSGIDETTTLKSWSMAKSILHGLVGILVRDGKLDVGARAAVPEWADPDDPRHAITLDQLLRMASGLKFVEDYDDADGDSDVVHMLYREGRADTAHYAASQPLIHPPGAHWSYSSGTSNIIARITRDIVGPPDQYLAWMRHELFDPLGMKSPVPKFDGAGTFIGSSFCFATARDFARFGYLYLRDGVWEGRRILPEGWVDYARTPIAQDPETPQQYGAHWWLRPDGLGTFSMNGYEGQYTFVIPALDLVLVRCGRTPAALRPALLGELGATVQALKTS